MTDSQPVGHAFISYVRQDAPAMEGIATDLAAADVPVWTDKENLSPGADWRVVIRKAIQNDALAFIAIFSKNSQSRDQTYQNEELALAIDQMRLRAPGKVWLIPVRLDDCDLPDFDLGGGRTLGSLQRVDLFGDDAERERIRLVSAVLRTLSDHNVDSATVQELVLQADEQDRGPKLSAAVKAMVLDPRRRIDLEDLLSSEARRAREAVGDEAAFPMEPSSAAADVANARAFAERFNRYRDAVWPLTQALATGGAYAESSFIDPLTHAVRAVASLIDGPKSGNTYLLAIEHYPVSLLVYAGTLGALSRRNYTALRAIAVEPVVRNGRDRAPVANELRLDDFESPFKAAANLLAIEADGDTATDVEIEGWLRRGGMRRTPVSDHLHAVLWPLLEPLVPDKEDYTDLFDRAEVLLSVLATDGYLQAEGTPRHVRRGGFGRFTWRYQHSDRPIHRVMQAEFESAGESWEPLTAGLFGGSAKRAAAAFEEYGDVADRVIAQRAW